MKATTEYMRRLLGPHRVPNRVSRYVDSARAERFALGRMHDLGIEPRREPEPLPAWAEAFGEKLHRYFYGGVEAEHTPTVS